MAFPKPEIIVAGVDLGGLGGDPFVMEMGARFDDGTWRNLAEFWSKRVTWHDILRVSHEWMTKYHCERFWVDASQLQTVQALAAAGIPAIATQIRDVEFRHRTLYSLAKSRRWRYNQQNCPQLHAEFQLFGFTKTRAGQVRMQSRNDHCLDCVGYYLASEGESPEFKREELPPEERPPYWKDEQGNVKFDPAAVIAHAKMVTVDDEFLPTWDEMINSEDDDYDQHQRDVWQALTGTPFPEREQK